jgi:hypothetical protein
MKCSCNAISTLVWVFVLTHILFLVPAVFACAPDFPLQIYNDSDILEAYKPLLDGTATTSANVNPVLNQQYQIITPAWGAEYLLPVYLSAENKTFTEPIKESLDFFYQDFPYYIDAPQDDPPEESQNIVSQWNQAALAIDGNVTDLEAVIEKSDKRYLYYQTEPYSRALEQLVDRESIYTPEELREWVRGQQQVFVGMFESSQALSLNPVAKSLSWGQLIKAWLQKTIRFPGNDSKSTKELLAADKEYQEAALAFYNENYSNAAQILWRIYQNPDHPHRGLAVLTLGRLFVRVDNLTYEKELENKNHWAESDYQKNLKATETYYVRVLKDKSLSSVHLELQKMLDYVLYRTDPVKRLIESENAMLAQINARPKDFMRQFKDWDDLIYHQVYIPLRYQKNLGHIDTYIQAINDNTSTFGKFIVSWYQPDRSSASESLSRYREHDNVMWLILAARQATPTTAEWLQIDNEIHKIPPTSPYYETAQYYLLIQKKTDTNQIGDVKKTAESLMAEAYKNHRLLSYNLFATVRESLETDFDSFAPFSLRYPLAEKFFIHVGTLIEPYMSQPTIVLQKPRLSAKAKGYVNQLPPQEMLVAIQTANQWPQSIRRYALLTAFNKALYQKNVDALDAIAKVAPAIDPSLSNLFSQYPAKSAAKEIKLFQAARISVFLPLVYDSISGGDADEFMDKPIEELMNIDNYHRNWITKEKCSTKFLMATTLDFMDKYPENRDPQLLHEIVNVSRYNDCKDEETTAYSKRAYQMLHNTFPTSTWAKQTKYWY